MYDVGNRLTREVHYDAENLRHEIVENGNLASFIFSHSEVVVETNTTDTIRLIRGYDIICSDSEKAKTYYHYASDELGSTTHIFEGDQLRNRYEYDAFGNITSQEETIHNRFKYTGQQHDPITQQYYLRARFYNPVIARFTQEDVYRGAGLNLYAYCDNNPVNYFDPSGYSPCPTKQDLYKRYRAEGYSAADANKMANTDLIRQKQGDAEADKYQAANQVKRPVKDEEQHYKDIAHLRELASLPEYRYNQKTGTVAKVYLPQSGSEYYGLNSTMAQLGSKKPDQDIRSSNPIEARRNIFQQLKEQGKIPELPHLGKAQYLSHAEANALHRAYERKGPLGEVQLYVDRPTCPNCKQYLHTLMDSYGITKLEVYNLGREEMVLNIVN